MAGLISQRTRAALGGSHEAPAYRIDTTPQGFELHRERGRGKLEPLPRNPLMGTFRTVDQAVAAAAADAAGTARAA